MIDRLLNAIGLVWKAEDGVHFNVTTEHLSTKEIHNGFKIQKEGESSEKYIFMTTGQVEGERRRNEVESRGV